MIIQQQDIPENWKCIMLSDNITGSQAWEHMLKTTFKDVEHVNNSKLTGNRWDLPFSRPFANCSMDFIKDLSPVKGHNSILVIVNQGLTKGIILISCSKMITAKQTVQLLLENLYKRFGLPDKIIFNQGPQFISKAFIKLLKLLGIKLSLSTTYHPQMDRTTEQVNQEIKV